MNDVLTALLITGLAGAATGLGGLVVLFTKAAHTRFLAACLSLSAGVMLYISFVEIFPKSLEDLGLAWGERPGYLAATLLFFAGLGIAALLERLVPHDPTTRSFLTGPDGDRAAPLGSRVTAGATLPPGRGELHRTGIMSALAVSLHNLPEGLVVFVAAMTDPSLGLAIAIAIALHNIPEGIATAAPIYHATGSRGKALLAATLSGLTEPLGGLLGWLALSAFVDDAVQGISFGLAGGIMVFVALDQLLPAARRYGTSRWIMGWLVAGMAVMAASLVALDLAGI